MRTMGSLAEFWGMPLLCSNFSYPVGLYIYFLSEPFFPFASCECSSMTVHMCILV